MRWEASRWLRAETTWRVVKAGFRGTYVTFYQQCSSSDNGMDDKF